MKKLLRLILIFLVFALMKDWQIDNSITCWDHRSISQV